MSIASSFSNALSGLSAVSRAADVVSSNIANAMTEGYARRELALSALSVGGQGAGVRVDGVIRVVNQAVLADRRLADAEVGNIALRAEFLNRLETLLGTPGTPGSLSDRIASFETALIEAASRPDSEARLQSVLTSAEAITSHLNKLTGAIQGERMSADPRGGARQQPDFAIHHWRRGVAGGQSRRD
ncbi:flagellar basal body protein [Phaeovulum veldkampii]|uniref:flagellar basal body protein n=1 Tax=Phaeovulum veldkampii TaxID=33049 RepID=UPI0010CFBF8F|nr:flagellar basal body protein [Phaeovulum veldkampii]TDQ57535.1 flagellar basal body rod protein [Phaeovulum veldkampii DSM 11550]